MHRSRRIFLGQASAAAIALGLGRQAQAAETPVEISWDDLIPRKGPQRLQGLTQRGVVQHGQMSTPPDLETGGDVTEAYNGKLVRIPGYLVPLDYQGAGVTAGLLVPYVGACIHVPPPPPNQLIYVTTSEPYESSGLFEPVYVTGMFGAAAKATQLAEVGYAISADIIEPYS